VKDAVSRGRSVNPSAEVIVAVTLLATASTVAVLSPAPVDFGHLLPSIAQFVSTLMGAVGVVLAGLLYVRHRRTLHLSDLLLCAAFALSALFGCIMPLVASVAPATETATMWVEIGGRFAVAVALFLAAWLPARQLRRGVSPGVVVALTSCLAVAVVGYVIIRGGLHGLPPSVRATSLSGRPLQVVSVPLLVAAVFGFTVRRLPARDAMAGWLAVAAVLLANAGVQEMFWPSVDPGWLTAADVLRTTAEVLILVGLLREVVLLWRQRVAEAAHAERRRVARELHDSVAQELAYLTTSALVVAEGRGADDPLRDLAASAQRALRETRAAITELSDDEVIRLDEVVEAVGEVAGARNGYPVSFDLAKVTVGERTGHELACVAGEAVENAARHGRAARIAVHLRQSRRAVKLRVVDDGCGIASPAEGTNGFGLTSMRERVEGLGGTCAVRPVPGGGTEVVVEVPRP
jgi:signal transduction histidine kinase